MTAKDQLLRMFPGGYGKDQKVRTLLQAALTDAWDEGYQAGKTNAEELGGDRLGAYTATLERIAQRRCDDYDPTDCEEADSADEMCDPCRARFVLASVRILPIPEEYQLRAVQEPEPFREGWDSPDDVFSPMGYIDEHGRQAD